MERKVKEALRLYVEKVAGILSDPMQNKNNTENEVFTPVRSAPLTEHTGYAIYKKDKSGLYAGALFYWVGNQWMRFGGIPTDSHVAGMLLFAHIKMKVEEMNYKVENEKEGLK